MKTSLLDRMFIPKPVRLRRLRSQIISYLESRREELSDEEIEVLLYLKEHELSVFPYEFTEEYEPSGVKVEFDHAEGMYYTYWEGKRLYHKRGGSRGKAQRYFNGLRLEQDRRSPHCYLSGTFTVDENDIIADIGAAEGNFSLSHIEKAGHVYLFEPEKGWVAALEATFRPWRKKVTIVNKFVSGTASQSATTLDVFMTENRPADFIKVDVEGSERELLRGGRTFLSNCKAIRLAICTYHRQEDARDLQALVKRFGLDTEFSAGYMLYHYGKNNVVKEPYLRRAVLRASKING